MLFSRFRSFFFTAGLGVALAAPAACTVDFGTATSSGSGGPASIINEYDASTGDDGGGDAMPVANDGAAVPYQGSPLCNFSNAQSACDPDKSTTAQSCGKQAAADAGSSSDAGAPAQSYRCYVQVDGVGNVTSQDCEPSGRGIDGDACQHGSDCAAGFECVGAGVCRHYCCDAVACSKVGKLTFCDVQTMTGGATPDTRVPVCMPVRTCKLLLPGFCDTSETCAPVRSDGTTSCVAIGSAKAGDACDREHCGKDLACLGAPGNRKCYQLCHTDAVGECPSGTKCMTSSAEFLDPTIGVCQ